MNKYELVCKKCGSSNVECKNNAVNDEDIWCFDCEDITELIYRGDIIKNHCKHKAQTAISKRHGTNYPFIIGWICLKCKQAILRGDKTI
ncbi:MAG: hypothetical protein KAQ85_05700 [Thermodesulfovibrionia bacterium]|nr:hypothetical protein [Thermodesulfovibrionia bacterium]